MTKNEFLVQLIQFGNIPYIWGGENPAVGLDCSGLAQKVLALLHLDPPGDQTADGLRRHFSDEVNGDVIESRFIDDYAIGDLLFFGKTDHATHITIYVGGGLMFEAAGGGSSTTTVEIAKQQRAYARVSRVDRRRDLIAVCRPHGMNLT